MVQLLQEEPKEKHKFSLAWEARFTLLVHLESQHSHTHQSCALAATRVSGARMTWPFPTQKKRLRKTIAQKYRTIK